MASQPKGMYEALREARKINPAVNESTLHSFAKQYKSELAKNPRRSTQQNGMGCWVGVHAWIIVFREV